MSIPQESHQGYDEDGRDDAPCKRGSVHIDPEDIMKDKVQGNTDDNGEG